MARAKHQSRALIQYAEREAKAALSAKGCARAVDHLGLASFYAGQAVGNARRVGSNGRKSSVVELITKARAHVASTCGSGALGASPAPKPTATLFPGRGGGKPRAGHGRRKRNWKFNQKATPRRIKS